MGRLHSDRLPRVSVALLLGLVLAVPVGAQSAVAERTAQVAQTAVAAADSVVSAVVEVGSREALLRLGLSDGRETRIALREGGVFIDRERVGDYQEAGELEQSWRSLLDRASDVSTGQMVTLLRQWSPPAGAGATAGVLIRDRLSEFLAGTAGQELAEAAPGVDQSDSIDKLLTRLEAAERRAAESQRAPEREERSELQHLLGHIGDGFAALFGLLISYAVLVAIGWAMVYFSNRPFERVSDTARRDTVRAGLIGLAAIFLAFPAFILGLLALTISIVGIPLLFAWVPLFPAAVALSIFVGYLATARGIGEGLVDRHFTGTDWYSRANSFYYVAIGLGLLFLPFALGAVLGMPGHLLEWLMGIVIGLGVLLNVIVGCVGFGSVLIRAQAALQARRERRRASAAGFEEETHV